MGQSDLSGVKMLHLLCAFLEACRCLLGFSTDPWNRGESQDVHNVLLMGKFPVMHQAHVFFATFEVHFICELAWLPAIIEALYNIGFTSENLTQDI